MRQLEEHIRTCCIISVIGSLLATRAIPLTATRVYESIKCMAHHRKPAHEDVRIIKMVFLKIRKYSRYH